jgi:oligopeptide transport system substrate-binding protein
VKRRGRITMGLAVVTLAGVISGCSAQGGTNQTGGQTTSSKPGEFSMYFIDDGHGFDPALWSQEVYQESAGIYEGLVHFDKNYQPAAGAAASWDHNANNTVYTFHLRTNAKFSNGNPVTAQDFVYEIERAVNPNTAVQEKASPVPINDVPIQNIQQIRAGNMDPSKLGVKALSDHTLQITLSRPDPNFLRDICLPQADWLVPLDQKVAQNMQPGDWTNPSKIVSNGPYMLKTYQAKTSATLVPNPHYWGKVSLKKITLQYSSNINQLVAFKNGALDEALLQPTDVPAVKKSSSLSSQLHMWDTSIQYTYVPMASQNNALQNPDVRKAFEMAIDKNVISQNVLNGTGTPAYGPYTPTWADPWIKNVAVPYNVKAAQALLAKAGYPGGKGFPTVVLEVGTTTDHVAEAIQQMWQTNLGVKVTFMGEEYGKFLQDMKKQLPANEVGWANDSQSGTYPQLGLPQGVGSYLYQQGDLEMGYLPANQWNNWYQLDQNQNMQASSKQTGEVSLFKNYLPSSYLNWVKEGYKAYQDVSNQEAQKFYEDEATNVYTIPIYTPKYPVLIRSNVTGYVPDHYILTLAPVWFNYIHVK